MIRCCETTEDQTMAAGHSVDIDPAHWQAGLDELLGRVARRFPRVEPRRRARELVLGLLADLPRKNCWTIAKHAGDPSPDGMQHLLARAVWRTPRSRSGWCMPAASGTGWSTGSCTCPARGRPIPAAARLPGSPSPAKRPGRASVVDERCQAANDPPNGPTSRAGRGRAEASGRPPTSGSSTRRVGGWVTRAGSRLRGRACTSCLSRRGRAGCGRPSCRPGAGAGWSRRAPPPR
jgi:hypothetical protein